MQGKALALLVALGSAVASTNVRATATDVTIVCTPAGVGTFPTRVHVRCQQSFSGVSVFAATTTDSAAAARYMSMATSALIAGRNLRVHYDPADQSGSSFGCTANECRLLKGLEIY